MSRDLLNIVYYQFSYSKFVTYNSLLYLRDRTNKPGIFKNKKSATLNPEWRPNNVSWWAAQDSNLWPLPRQGSVLPLN